MRTFWLRFMASVRAVLAAASMVLLADVSSELRWNARKLGTATVIRMAARARVIISSTRVKPRGTPSGASGREGTGLTITALRAGCERGARPGFTAVRAPNLSGRKRLRAALIPAVPARRGA